MGPITFLKSYKHYFICLVMVGYVLVAVRYHYSEINVHNVKHEHLYCVSLAIIFKCALSKRTSKLCTGNVFLTLFLFRWVSCVCVSFAAGTTKDPSGCTQPLRGFSLGLLCRVAEKPNIQILVGIA